MSRTDHSAPHETLARETPAIESRPTSVAGRFTSGRRRMLSEERTPGLWTGALDGAPVWVSGLLAGLQAAVFSLLAVVLPALAAYVATSADPSLTEVGWWSSITVGIGLWLLGHGSYLVTQVATITITPLGITALALFACYVSARRSARTAWSSWLAGIVGYAAVAALLTLTQSVGAAAMARAALGAGLIAAIGLGGGMLARPDAPTLRTVSRRLWEPVPAPIRSGAAAGVVASAALVGVGAVVSIIWIVRGQSAIGAIVAGLGLDAVGGIVLAVAELAVLPNLVVWSLAWLAGPGFGIGQGSVYSPTEVVSAPLPALPIMGALPGRVDLASAPELTPVVVVLVGVLAGWYLSRRLVRDTWWTPLLAVLAGVVTTWLGTFVLMAAASGSAGPGRLADVGAHLGTVPLVIAAEVALGLALVAAPRNPEFRAAVRRAWRSLAARVGRSPQDADADAVDGVTD